MAKISLYFGNKFKDNGQLPSQCSNYPSLHNMYTHTMSINYQSDSLNFWVEKKTFHHLHTKKNSLLSLIHLINKLFYCVRGKKSKWMSIEMFSLIGNFFYLLMFMGIMTPIRKVWLQMTKTHEMLFRNGSEDRKLGKSFSICCFCKFFLLWCDEWKGNPVIMSFEVKEIEKKFSPIFYHKKLLKIYFFKIAVKIFL